MLQIKNSMRRALKGDGERLIRLAGRGIDGSLLVQFWPGLQETGGHLLLLIMCKGPREREFTTNGFN